MKKEQVALIVFSSQDEREENEECFLDLLISKAILDTDDSDDLKTELFYWMNQIEIAINKIEDIEHSENSGGSIYFEK